ncbi:MAG: hypothetical protein R2795_17450 [Saprospiraceae bacterium]
MRRFPLLFIVCLLLLAGSGLQSCSKKSGCPAIASTKVKTKRNGELSTKRGKSTLFPKDMQRAKKKKRKQ